MSTAAEGTVIFVKLIIDQGKAPNDSWTIEGFGKFELFYKGIIVIAMYFGLHCDESLGSEYYVKP